MPLYSVFLFQPLCIVTLPTGVCQADEGIYIRFSDVYVIYNINKYLVPTTFIFTKETHISS